MILGSGASIFHIKVRHPILQIARMGIMASDLSIKTNVKQKCPDFRYFFDAEFGYILIIFKNSVKIFVFIEIALIKNACIPAQQLKKVRTALFRLYVEIKNKILPVFLISRINQDF